MSSEIISKLELCAAFVAFDRIASVLPLAVLH
jgi:hypothetical protein